MAVNPFENIVNIYRSIQNLIDTGSRGDEDNFSSIATKASRGILQFPMIISNSIPLETAMIVSKSCERAYGSFVMTSITLCSDLRGNESVINYLNRTHQNTDINMDEKKSVSYYIEAAYTKDVKPYVNRVLKEQNVLYGEEFSKVSLNNVYKSSSLKDVRTTLGYSIKPVYETGEKTDLPTKILMDVDVKKANEMQPTMLNIKLVRNRGNNSAENVYNLNIGVKTTLHSVGSQEMIDNVLSALDTNKGVLFNFIRWTTGEISFLRDFVLRLDDVKKNLKNKEIQKSPWWIALRKRAQNARAHKFSTTNILPNATIVMSMDEVQILKSNFNFNLMKESNAKKIIDEFFLLGFIILDQANEIAYILYDGYKNYQELTFRGLERENGDAERQFKNILKAVNKL